jgi:hypothetical protein
MNVTDYTYLINKPDAIHEKQTEVWKSSPMSFLIFKVPEPIKRALQPKQYKYNEALKLLLHSTDRSVLFEFITSDTFTYSKGTI